MEDPGKSLTGHLLAEKVILALASLAPATSLVKMIDNQTREFADGTRGAHLLVCSLDPGLLLSWSNAGYGESGNTQGPSAPNWMIKWCN